MFFLRIVHGNSNGCEYVMLLWMVYLNLGELPLNPIEQLWMNQWFPQYFTFGQQNTHPILGTATFFLLVWFHKIISFLKCSFLFQVLPCKVSSLNMSYYLPLFEKKIIACKFISGHEKLFSFFWEGLCFLF